ncbi:MAG: NACHT domain-containing protein [Anaeromyxobacter sp.]|nr:NACHT domain-containing protein [Anaeromyxobacter sp.]MBL0276496.1 NACHT domain-containing protein [Anaeromyxobacter sp.]
MTNDEITTLLAPFADPATPFELRDLGDTFGFKMLRSGIQFAGFIDKASGQVVADGLPSATIKQFLASKRMAGLEALAQTQARVFDTTHLVARPVQLDGVRHEDGLEAISSLAPKANGATRVVILSGPAGMGKTSLVQALVNARAQAFLRRSGDRLALLVSSRGRRLSLLNDVIAATLGDLRAPIINHEIPPLVRSGLVELVIDGFDELVNSDGYRDAWESVGHLLGQIGRGGLVVLSARDAFFSEQDFVERARRETIPGASNIDFSFLELLPLDEAAIRALVTLRGVSEPLREEVSALCMALPEGLRGRPFFAERIAAKVAAAGAIEFRSPLTVAIEEFVERELPLVFGSTWSSAEGEALHAFFEEVAIEMRRQESDSLDVDSISFFLDLILEGAGVSPDRRKALVHRAEAVAFMEVGRGARRRGFPHEVVRDHFVSRRVLSLLASPGQGAIREALGFGTFSLDLADSVCLLLDHRGTEVSAESIGRVLSIAREAGPGDALGQNACALAFALARRIREEEAVVFEDLSAGNVSFADTRLGHLVFRRCGLASLDLCDCDARLATLENCDLGRLRISADTKVPNSLIDGATVRLLENQSAPRAARESRDPRSIREVLAAHVATADDGRLSAGQDLLLRLAIRWRRTGYLEDDGQKTPVFADPLWPAIRDILERNGRLEWKFISSRDTGSGRARVGIMRDANAIIQRFHRDPAQQIEISRLWSEASEVR